MRLIDVLKPGVKAAELSASSVPPPTSLVSGPYSAMHGGAQVGVRSPWSGTQLQTIALSDFLGVTPNLMTRAIAIRVPAVARARHVLAGTIGRVVLREYLAGQAEPIPEAQQAAWIAPTNTAVSAFHRMLWTVDDLFFSGWSCWARRDGVDGRPLQLDRIDIGRWSFNGDGLILVDGELVNQRSVLAIPGPHEGLLNFAGDSIRHARDLETGASTAAKTPSAHIVLKQTGGTPLTRDQVEQLRKDWAEARAGLHGGVAYLNQSVEATELGSYSAQLVVEGRNAAAVDIARHASLPAEVIDAVTAKSMTYANSRDNDRRLIDYGAGMYMAAISAVLSQDNVVPRGHRVGFDLEEWLKGAPPLPGAAPTTGPIDSTETPA